MAYGRPTSLTDEVKAQCREYLNSERTVHSAVDLAVELGISKKTLYNWAEKDEDILHTLSAINTLQERELTNNGLSGKFNSTITKLMLANHGYSDASKVDHTTKGKELPTPILGGTSVSGSNSHEEDSEDTQ